MILMIEYLLFRLEIYVFWTPEAIKISLFMSSCISTFLTICNITCNKISRLAYFILNCSYFQCCVINVIAIKFWIFYVFFAFPSNPSFSVLWPPLCWIQVEGLSESYPISSHATLLHNIIQNLNLLVSGLIFYICMIWWFLLVFCYIILIFNNVELDYGQGAQYGEDYWPLELKFC